MNFLQHEDHVRIKLEIERLREVDWVITYDDCSEILNLYHDHVCKRISWNYSAATKRAVEEIIIFRNKMMIPTEMDLLVHKVKTTLRDVDVCGIS